MASKIYDLTARIEKGEANQRYEHLYTFSHSASLIEQKILYLAAILLRAKMLG